MRWRTANNRRRAKALKQGGLYTLQRWHEPEEWTLALPTAPAVQLGEFEVIIRGEIDRVMIVPMAMLNGDREAVIAQFQAAAARMGERVAHRLVEEVRAAMEGLPL